MKKILSAAVSVVVLASFGETFYVDGSVEVSGDGSQKTPVRTIAEGIALAKDLGDVVRVAKGEYPITSTIEIAREITLEGATGNPDDVIIDAQNGCPVINVQDTAGSAKIFSLTFRRGRGVNGGAVAANSRAGGITLWSAAMVSNCVATGASQNTNSGRGGVFIPSKAGALVTHCKIWGNDVSGGSGSGAGVYMQGGTVADCLIVSNKCKSSNGAVGGGVFIEQTGRIVNCTIADNAASSGGGVFVRWATKNALLHNSIVIRNSSVSGGDIAGNTEAGTRNCAFSGAVVGTGNVDLGALIPFDSEYRLTAAGNSVVGGWGDPSLVNGAADYWGTARPADEEGVVTSTDIGCAQYVASTKKQVTFEAYPRNGAGPTTVTFTAIPDGGLDLSECTCTWYLNGEVVTGETGPNMVKTLPVGFYSVKFVAADSEGSYEWEEKGDDPVRKYISISPADVYVSLGGDGEPPYDLPTKAGSNLLMIAQTYLQSGVTLHIENGAYPLTDVFEVSEGERVIGSKDGGVVLYALIAERHVMEVNGVNAYVEGICLSNANGAAGLSMIGDGGNFTCGKIVQCVGAVNQPGGGLRLDSDHGCVSRTVICGNATYGSDRVTYIGGGAYVRAGRLENCLVVSNTAAGGGGVYVDGIVGVARGRVCNSTIVGNVSIRARDNKEYFGGGVYQSVYGDLVNCIVTDNAEAGDRKASLQVSSQDGATAQCCWTADPLFKDAAKGDYRIGVDSPCAYSGVYEDWMADATDFFGYPRATPGKKVSIGYCQVPGPGLMLLVK